MGGRGQNYPWSYVHIFKGMFKYDKLDNIIQLALDPLFLIQKGLETNEVH